MEIIGQRGTAVIVIAEDSQGDQVKCLMREAGDIYLESCTPGTKQGLIRCRCLQPLPRQLQTLNQRLR